MIDREKVIKDLEECLSASCRGFRPRLSCPYNDEEWDIMRDALALLKEQEIVRCKDCRRNHQCAVQSKFAYPDDEENWFCAYGKRR